MTDKAPPATRQSALKAKLASHKAAKQEEGNTEKVSSVEALIGASEAPRPSASSNAGLKQRIAELEAALDKKAASEGKPLVVPIGTVIENPDHPNSRQDQAPDFEAWLLESIKEHGVQDPISVTWSAEHEKWIINKGHTRRKVAEKAGLKEVPIIIQDNQTDWNQVIENLIRKDLSTRDMVNFIAKKKSEGMKQKDIAKKLSRDPGWISKHVALENPPTFISHLWEQGYASDFTTLYSLVTCYKFDSAATEKEVNKIIANKPSISFDDAEQIKVKLAGKKNTDKPPVVLGEGEPAPAPNKKTNEVDDEREEAEKPEEEQNKTPEPPAEKTKTLRVKVSVDDSLGYLLIERTGKKGNVLVELTSGGTVELPSEEVKLLGVVLA